MMTSFASARVDNRSVPLPAMASMAFVDEVGPHLVQLAWDELTGRGVYYGANASDASQCQGDDVYIAGAARGPDRRHRRPTVVMVFIIQTAYAVGISPFGAQLRLSQAVALFSTPSQAPCQRPPPEWPGSPGCGGSCNATGASHAPPEQDPR
jgi:hypothetical protein